MHRDTVVNCGKKVKAAKESCLDKLFRLRGTRIHARPPHKPQRNARIQFYVAYENTFMSGMRGCVPRSELNSRAFEGQRMTIVIRKRWFGQDKALPELIRTRLTHKRRLIPPKYSNGSTATDAAVGLSASSAEKFRRGQGPELTAASSQLRVQYGVWWRSFVWAANGAPEYCTFNRR
jgi:hypothetical protein